MPSSSIKSSLYSLNTLSGVASERCPSPRLCARDHTLKVAAVASRWQRVGDLFGSGFELHNTIFKLIISTVTVTIELIPTQLNNEFKKSFFN